MRHVSCIAGVFLFFFVMFVPQHNAPAMCGYVWKDRDVTQPAQKAFITWDPKQHLEEVTVQPMFEGRADDFGMLIPTPGRPKIDEMPRDFFKALSVFTILKPLDTHRFADPHDLPPGTFSLQDPGSTAKKDAVRVLEAGIVGSLDYKVIEADKPDALLQWLSENRYKVPGDGRSLDYYIRRKWVFTVMKIDPAQMKRSADGSYTGEITPTRFTFQSEALVYPLKITQPSVKNNSEAVFYVQTPWKMDLPTPFSYEPGWQPMFVEAMQQGDRKTLTRFEQEWSKYAEAYRQPLQNEFTVLRQGGHEPAVLVWAKRITDDDISMLGGDKQFDRVATPEEIQSLRLLKGHIKKGQFITKIRKVLSRQEMKEDVEFGRARLGKRDDDTEYFELLPTSP